MLKQQILLLRSRANLFLHENRIEEVIEACSKLLRLDPYNFTGIHCLGIALKRKGEYKKALLLFLKCTKINPTNADVWSNIAEIYDKNGDFEQSKIYASKAVELYSKSYRPYFYLGNAYFFEKSYAEAIKYYKNALNCNFKLRAIIRERINYCKIQLNKSFNRDCDSDVLFFIPR